MLFWVLQHRSFKPLKLFVKKHYSYLLENGSMAQNDRKVQVHISSTRTFLCIGTKKLLFLQKCYFYKNLVLIFDIFLIFG